MDLLLPLLLFLPDSAKMAIGIALGLGVFISMFFYMVANVFQHPPLFAMAKEEISALIFSAILILVWVGTSSTIDPIAKALIAPSGYDSSSTTGGIYTSHVSLAYASLDILFHKLRELYTSMYLFEALIGFLSTISFPMGSPMPGPAIISFSLMPFDGLGLLSNAHTVVVESIGQLMTVVWAKQFILIFCRDVVPVIFLPLGLVFRAIPFLRSTGSSILAICFAGYFVLPFAILFSNFLIFDVFTPSEFVYAPDHIGPYKGDKSQADVEGEINTAKKEGGDKLLDLFTSESLAEKATTSDECSGNAVVRAFCSFGNVIVGAGKLVYGFATQVFSIWKFMVGLSGDFYGFFSAQNQLLPSSATAGLYFFIIDAVVAHSQFAVVVLLTSVFEIIITITMYRNIAMITGGEVDIAGLAKII